MTALACLLALVFAVLAGLHVYWAGGGKWAGAATLPKHADGRPLFQIHGARGALACLIMAVGLGAFGHLCLAQVGLAPKLFLAGRIPLALLVISGIFALRSLGDFKYVGLFRRVHGTDFARLDRLVYTPLCLALTVGLAWLALAPIK